MQLVSHHSMCGYLYIGGKRLYIFLLGSKVSADSYRYMGQSVANQVVQAAEACPAREHTKKQKAAHYPGHQPNSMHHSHTVLATFHILVSGSPSPQTPLGLFAKRNKFQGRWKYGSPPRGAVDAMDSDPKYMIVHGALVTHSPGASWPVCWPAPINWLAHMYRDTSKYNREDQRKPRRRHGLS